jgi:hypothetical protein
MVLERRCDGGGTCGEDADSLFRPSSGAKKNQERKYVVAYAAKKQAKIYDNQLKQCRRRGRGISNETPSGRNIMGGRSPVVWGGKLSDAKKMNNTPWR